MQRAATFGNRQAPGVAAGRRAIGIDVGGTKIAGGVVDLASGAVSRRMEKPTGFARGGEAVLADVVHMAQDLGGAGAALGIGVAELVDPEGRVFSDYRIKWRGLDLAARLAAEVGAKAVTVSSDVRAAALAEARYGAGRGGADFYYVTIGTGISGVLVQDGVPYAGTKGAGLVIANGPERSTCPACGHVEARVVEDIASGPALAAAFGPGFRAEDVVAAAQAGDARAWAVIGHATAALGPVLALLAGALDPDRLVIGGGLGSAPGPYFDSLAKAIRAGLWVGYRQDLPIVQAALGPDAGLIGAAAATMHAQEPAHRPLPIT